MIVEDIIDTGTTISNLINEMRNHQPREIRIATLLLKPDMLKYDLEINYVGFTMPVNFLIGYGLDYNEIGRNLNEIYALVK